LSIRWPDGQNGLKLHHKPPPNRVCSWHISLALAWPFDPNPAIWRTWTALWEQINQCSAGGVGA